MPVLTLTLIRERQPPMLVMVLILITKRQPTVLHVAIMLVLRTKAVHANPTVPNTELVDHLSTGQFYCDSV